jgi:hemoglobin/transferrin/lactoferrin receptor protein
VGDDATYDLFGVYLQDHIAMGNWEVIGGVRFTYASADAKRVDNPAVAGSDPTTPGNIIRVKNDWTNLSASLRGIYHVNRRWSVYGGISQAFRTPSLHDLTSLESTSVVETPAPGLEPEEFLSFELGLKTEQQRLRGGLAAWYTVLDNTIVRSPTGVLIGGTPEVRKDNIGDGWVWGVDLDLSWRADRDWTWFGTLSYMDGEVDQLDAGGVLTRRPLSRMKPLSFWTGLRYAPTCSRFWAQADVEHSAREDRLSFRDEGDSRRIPPGGTPAWTRVNLRAGATLSRTMRLSLALENLLDENYRIHGSGQNEPGRSLVFALDVDL